MNRNTAPPDVPKWTPLAIMFMAVVLALTTGADQSRLALEINPLSGVAYRSNLTVPTVITAGTFVGDLAGDITVITTNWMPNLTVTGAAALGPSMSGNGAGVTNIQTNNVAGLASFISAIAPSGGGGGGTNWYATLTVTGTANLGQISGDGSGITNIFSTPTNWASSMTITGLLDLGRLTLGYPGSWSFLTGNVYQFGRLYATNEQNLLGGQGVGLTNVPTSGVAGLHSLITNIASGPSNITSHLTDIDTCVAPASVGTPTWYDPENGQSWDATEIWVYPMYSNALGVVYGDALSASHWGGNSYQAWAWPAQPGAFLYHVHAHTYYGVDETDVYGQTSATNIMVDALTGTNIASRPSTLSVTNEVRSLYLMSLYGSGGSNAITSIAAPLTNGHVTGSITNTLAGTGYVNVAVAGATSSLSSASSVYPSTNRTAYADPSFPLYSPPYFGNIQSALVWLGSSAFPDGTVTNHGVLRISGQWSVSGSRLDCTSDKYDWLEIDATGATVDANVASVGNEKGWLDFGANTDRVRVYGGKWRGRQDSNNNGSVLVLRGNYARASNLDVWVTGSNWNFTGGIIFRGNNASIIGIRSAIAPGPKGTGIYYPIFSYGSSALVENCSFDVFEKPNTYLNALNAPGAQYVGCRFRFHSNAGNSGPLFLNVGADSKWESCTFANVINMAAFVTGHVALVAPAGGAAEWVSGSGYTGGYDNDGNPEAYYQALRVYPFRTNAAGVVNCSTNAPMQIDTYSPTDYGAYDISWVWTNGFNAAWTNTHGWRLVRYDEENGWSWNKYRDLGRDTTNLLDDATGWSDGAAVYNWTTNYVWPTNAPTAAIGRSTDTARTTFFTMCVFNQSNWHASSITPITNLVVVATNIYTGITVPSPE